MNKLYSGLEMAGVIAGTFSALAGEIDLAILFWVLAIFMAIKGR